MTINCIVIDDTPLAIEKLERFIKEVPLLNLLGSFTNGIEALSFMKSEQVDLVFLDIQMELFSGLQFLESLEKHPKIIIVSAYSEYAVKGFDYSVTDYLLKPYLFERFLKAVDKVQNEMDSDLPKEYMFVKTEYRMERIDFSDILYIEGQGAYLGIVTKEARVMTLQSFKKLEKCLPSNNFMRIHKSYIIALDKIEIIERNTIIINEQRIPVGLNYRELFFNSLKSKE